MSKLVNELKQEHHAITDILLELQKIGASTTKGMELLMQSKTSLLAHLTKEDKQLYPYLHEKAKSDLSLRKTLDTFGAEMEKITEFVFDFYQKYFDSVNINKTEFVKDISKFIVTLKSRIMREEVAIYKAYEKLKLD
ncbi:MAG: hypothetical protein GQ564_21755 [Bacteroidales bacterium]|nr:hypothetical protein [Bacteroidales bacterium]